VKHWKVILATLVIFVAGLVTGAVLSRKAQPKAPTTLSPEVFFQGPFYIQKQFMGRMKQELALTEAQADNLEKIFANSRERIRILLDVVGPEMRQELDAVRQGIEKELTTEQEKKFEDLLRKTRHGRFTGPPSKDRRPRGRETETGTDTRRDTSPDAPKSGDRRAPPPRPPRSPAP
jgi:hypothetical protein